MYLLILIALCSVICFNDEVKADCGGVIEETSGVITSPFYPSKYPPNRRCVWEINTPADTRILLRFTDFRMQGCYRDYVIIRSRSGNGTIIHQWDICALPNDTILAESNNVTVEFLSDGSVEQEGFQLEFFYVVSKCGGFIEGSAGVLTSPQHPNLYPKNANCLWTIQAPLNHKIKLDFKKFHTEGVSSGSCTNDFVTVRSRTEGGNTKEHGKFCGDKVPPPVISESNVLLVNFRTDGSIEFSGYLAEFSTVFSNCGELIEGSAGAISFPRQPLTYANNANCTWTIQAPANHSLKLNFEKFHIAGQSQCQSDYLTVKSKMTDGSTREHGRFCGTENPPVIFSGSNVLLIQFVSGFRSQDPGFRAVFSSHVCGGVIEGGKGNISTLFYPDFYPPNQVCEWTFSVPSQHKIKLRFIHFEIEQGGKDCLNDFVLIQTRTAHGEIYRHGKYCGSSKPPSIYTRDSIQLKFVSDSNVQSRGLKVEYVIDKLSDYELSNSMRSNQKEASTKNYETDDLLATAVLTSKDFFSPRKY